MSFSIYFQIMAVFLLGLAACGYSSKQNNLNPDPGMQEFSSSTEDPAQSVPSLQSYRLWHTVDQFDLKSFQYYGGFFEERLKFFYTNDPGLRLANADVDLLMLYFLDDRLVKIRYHLDQDITDPLLDSLGLGLLKTRYNRNKQIMATDKTILRLKTYNQQKGNPDKYDIIWDRQIIESSYHVDPNPSSLYSFDTVRAHFVFIDQLKSYRKNLIALEKELRSKMMLSAEN